MKKLILLLISFLLMQETYSQCNLIFNANSNCSDSIYLNVTNGTPPFSFSISPNSGTLTSNGYANVAAGTYTITTTDAMACTATSVVNVQVPLTATPTVVNASCPGSCDGQITINALGGGGGPLAYALNNLTQTSNIFSNLCPGYYSGYVYNGCQAYSFQTYVYLSSNVNVAPIITQPTACNGTGSAQFTVSGGTAPYLYTVTPGNIQNSTGYFPNLNPGNYTISVNNAGSTCSWDSIFVINSPNNLQVGNYNYSSQCGSGGTNGSYIYPYYSGGVSPVSITLSPNAGTLSGLSYINLPNGTYTVTATDAMGCTATSTAIINGSNVIPGLSTSSIVINPNCWNASNGSIDLTVSGFLGALTYDWNNGFASTQDLTNIPGGNYSCTITDPLTSDCYIHYDSIGSLASQLYVTSLVTQPSCSLANGSITMTPANGTAPFTFVLTPGNIVSSTGIFTNLLAGIYTVTYNDINSVNCTQSQVFTLANSGNAFLNLSVSSSNCSSATPSSIYAFASGPNQPFTYTISPTSGTQNGATFTNLSNGLYTVTATSATGCSVTSVAMINGSTQIPGLVVTSNTQNPTCSLANGSIDLTVTGFSGALNYNWNSGLATTQDITNLYQGFYSCMITDPLTGNCFVYSDSLYTSYISYTMNQYVQPSCANNDGIMEFIGVGGIAPYTFTLNPGNITNTTGLFTGLSAGIYTVDITDASTSGCPQTNYLTLSSSTNLYLYVSAYSASCSTSQTQSSTIYYSTSQAVSVTITPVAPSSGQGYFSNLANGTYTITATDGNGCTVTSTAIINGANIIPGISVSSTIVQETCWNTNDASIDLTVTGGPANLNYNWNNGLATTQDLNNISAGYYSCLITDPLTGNCFTWSDSIGINGTNCGSISGKVFDDDNTNCVQNGNEISLANVLITLSNGQIAYTNWNGEYSIMNVPYGNYTITQTLPAGVTMNGCTQPSAISLSISNPNAVNEDFKDNAPNLCEASITAWPNSQFLPGNIGQYHIFYNRNSNTSCNADIYFIVPQGLSYSSSTVPPSNVYSTPNGDSLVWLNMPLTYTSQHIYVYVSIPVTAVMGTPITSHGHITALGLDNVAYNNDSWWTRQISAAYDPNDKSVSPIGTGTNGGITLAQNRLDYLIRFQNVGTAAAQNVIILDTMSSYLDLNTFRVTSYSHPYTVNILNGNILKFTFSNIFLPDSNTNEPGSHGYISYNIAQKANNVIGNVINNSAAIYFDYAEPVITNTTVNTIVAPASIKSTLNENNLVKIYPSPATTHINISFEKVFSSETKVALINAVGAIIYETSISANQRSRQINLGDMASGMYTLKLTNEEGSLIQKIVIQK